MYPREKTLLLTPSLSSGTPDKVAASTAASTAADLGTLRRVAFAGGGGGGGRQLVYLTDGGMELGPQAKYAHRLFVFWARERVSGWNVYLSRSRVCSASLGLVEGLGSLVIDGWR